MGERGGAGGDVEGAGFDVEDLVVGVSCEGWGKGEGEEERTLEARAEGSLVVPKSSVDFARSTSLTFW